MSDDNRNVEETNIVHGPYTPSDFPELDEATRTLVDNAVAGMSDAFNQRNLALQIQESFAAHGIRLLYDPMWGMFLAEYGNIDGGRNEFDDEYDAEYDDEYVQAQSASINDYQPPFKPAPADVMDQVSPVEKFEDKPCPVCLDDDMTPEGLVKTQCNHIFHKECLRDWLSRGDFCPVCRNAFKS